MSPGILLLAGRRSVGKSTAAAHLVANHGAIEIGQADPLKDLCGSLFGWDRSILHGPSSARDAVDARFSDRAAWREAFERLERFGPPWLKSLGLSPGRYIAGLRAWLALLGVEGIGKGITPRRALQTLGTDWGRKKVGPDVWINAALTRALFHIQEGAPLVVISDGRFENEIDRTREAGGKVLLIEAPGIADKPGDEHASERGLEMVLAEKFDRRVFNHKIKHTNFHAAIDLAIAELFKVAA